MRIFFSFVISLSLCWGSVAPSEAWAKPSKAAKKTAKKLQKKAKKAKKKKKWDVVIESYKGAFEAVPKAKHLGEIGRAYAKKGEPVLGVVYVEREVEGLEDGKLKTKAQKELAKLTEALEKTHGRLRLRSVPKGARYKLTKGEKRRSGTTPDVLWLEAGKWELKVKKERYLPRKKTLTIEAGRFLKKKYKLKTPVKEEPEEEPKVAAAPAPPPPPSPAPRGPGLNWTAIASVSAGVLGLGGGVYFGLESAGEQDRRDKLFKDGAFLKDIESADESAKSAALLSNVMLLVGVLGVGAGAALFLMGGSSTAANATFGVVPQPAGGIVTYGGAL